MGFGYRFRLYLANGEDIGTDPESLGDESEFHGVWTVTPLELPSS